jgi:hypothetical protein
MAPLPIAAVARQLISQYNAALMLHERTRVVLVYLRAVHKGVVRHRPLSCTTVMCCTCQPCAWQHSFLSEGGSI